MSTTEEEQLRALHCAAVDEVAAIMSAKQAEYRERQESYMGRLRWFATRLDAASDDNPVARAVCDLHRFEETPNDLQCAECLLYEDAGEPWPCETITAVADALGIEVPTL